MLSEGRSAGRGDGGKGVGGLGFGGVSAHRLRLDSADGDGEEVGEKEEGCLKGFVRVGGRGRGRETVFVMGNQREGMRDVGVDGEYGYGFGDVERETEGVKTAKNAILKVVDMDVDVDVDEEDSDRVTFAHRHRRDEGDGDGNGTGEFLRFDRL